MAVALVSSEMEPIKLESFRSRLKELSEMRIDPLDSSHAQTSDPEKFLADFHINLQEIFKQNVLEEPKILNLGPEDLEAHLEQLKEGIALAEAENRKISSEIDTLTRTVAEGSAIFDGDLEMLASSLNLMDSQGLHNIQAGAQNGRSISGNVHENSSNVSDDHKFEIWELDQKIEKTKFNLSTLQELDYALRSIGTIGEIEDIFSEAKVIKLEGNCIRLSLKTPISISSGLFFRNKLDCLTEPLVLDHELLIEFVDESLELKNVEIFPGDVYLDGIVEAVKSSRSSSIPMVGSCVGWFLRQIHYHILLCTLRRLVVNDANKSRRHLFEYSDKDEMIIAHLVGGIDAFVRIPHGWPISTAALKLVSIKSSDAHSKSISLGFLCKVKEVVNSLDAQKRRHLASFVDEIEEILVETRNAELHA